MIDEIDEKQDRTQLENNYIIVDLYLVQEKLLDKTKLSFELILVLCTKIQ